MGGQILAHRASRGTGNPHKGQAPKGRQNIGKKSVAPQGLYRFFRGKPMARAIGWYLPLQRSRRARPNVSTPNFDCTQVPEARRSAKKQTGTYRKGHPPLMEIFQKLPISNRRRFKSAGLMNEGGSDFLQSMRPIDLIQENLPGLRSKRIAVSGAFRGAGRSRQPC